MIRSVAILIKPTLRNHQWTSKSLYSTQLSAKVDDAPESKNEAKIKEDDEWNNALPFDSIPGPSKMSLIRAFLPGGKLYNKPLPEMFTLYRQEYGDIFKLPGTLGKSDAVITFDPENFQKVFRTEGHWPERQILESVLYYRKKYHPELAECPGLALSQGKEWGDVRSVTNPVMMQPKTVKLYVSTINTIGNDILNRVREIRDPKTLVTPATFEDEINIWALESICLIALDTRLGLIGNKDSSPEAQKLINAIKVFFPLLAEMDFKIPFWKIIKTANFKKYIQSLTDMNAVSKFYINKALARFEANAKSGDQTKEDSVLEKLLKINPKIAYIMASDMLLAGVDTTSSGFVALSYQLAKHPEKQRILQKELKQILPNKDSPLTPENMNRMPYLRACFKESARLLPVTNANTRNTGQNLVMSGYQVPKGVTALMPSSILQVEEKHFPKAKEFIPERWLKEQPAGCPSAKTANPFIFLPFGFGPRSCIGRRFAELEIEVMAAKIFRNFFVEWALPDDLKFKSVTINVPDGELRFKFTDLQD